MSLNVFEWEVMAHDTVYCMVCLILLLEKAPVEVFPISLLSNYANEI